MAFVLVTNESKTLFVGSRLLSKETLLAMKLARSFTITWQIIRVNFAIPISGKSFKSFRILFFNSNLQRINFEMVL